MERLAFTMKLYRGFEAEYKKRHDEIWPELVQLLKSSGIEDYSIFLDEETSTLFGVMKCADKNAFNSLPFENMMKKWWAYMSDIMESNTDNSPVSKPLREVFYLA